MAGQGRKRVSKTAASNSTSKPRKVAQNKSATGSGKQSFAVAFAKESALTRAVANALPIAIEQTCAEAEVQQTPRSPPDGPDRRKIDPDSEEGQAFSKGSLQRKEAKQKQEADLKQETEAYEQKENGTSKRIAGPMEHSAMPDAKRPYLRPSITIEEEEEEIESPIFQSVLEYAEQTHVAGNSHTAGGGDRNCSGVRADPNEVHKASDLFVLGPDQTLKAEVNITAGSLPPNTLRRTTTISGLRQASDLTSRRSSFPRSSVAGLAYIDSQSHPSYNSAAGFRHVETAGSTAAHRNDRQLPPLRVNTNVGPNNDRQLANHPYEFNSFGLDHVHTGELYNAAGTVQQPLRSPFPGNMPSPYHQATRGSLNAPSDFGRIPGLTSPPYSTPGIHLTDMTPGGLDPIHDQRAIIKLASDTKRCVQAIMHHVLALGPPTDPLSQEIWAVFHTLLTHATIAEEKLVGLYRVSDE